MQVVQIEYSVLSEMKANTGENLFDLSKKKLVMLVFLRHFGCTFCRKSLLDLSKRQESIKNQGISLVLVHMSDEDTAKKYFARYRLQNFLHLSDPSCKYYRIFGLVKGNFQQLFGFSSWMKGFQAGIVEGHGIGRQLGDGFQMPGMFLIDNGRVIHQFVHKKASDTPDYDRFVNCCEKAI